ncbi:MAG: TonB-dependent receptor [Prolixibacteraceae bacterium]|nr:TonB-dependent receptor [Prolixibacteraceae bacterium]
MKTLFLLMILFSGSAILAQSTIRGKITNVQNEPLPGASVVIDGTTQGTVADNNGEFLLQNPEDENVLLKVSFIGYKPYKEEIGPGADSYLNIVLQETDVITEEVFVYATRAGSNTPVTSTTVGQEEIEEKNLGQDIPYLLNTTPSFVSTSDAGAGIGYTGFRVRGTDANRINVTVNGIPINDAESHGVFWVNMPDFSSSIENIQVQRGVGTSTQGAAAFGATINMQTNTLRKKPYFEYNGAAGSFNTLKNTVQVGSGLINGHFSFDARLSKINTDGFIDRAFSNLKSFYVSGGYYSEKTLLKLNIFSGKEKTYQAWGGIDSETLASGNRTFNPYTYENETDNYQQDHYQLLFNHKFSETINMNAALHYTKGKGYYEQFKEGEDFADYRLDDIIVGTDTITSTDLIRQKWLDNDFFGGTFSVNRVTQKSEFTMGAGWNKYIGDHFGNIIWAQFADNMEKDYEWYNNKGVKTDFNVYAKMNYALTGNLNIYADIQYRNILYSIDGIDDDLRDLTMSKPYDFINPKMGLLYKPTDRSKAYISWAVGHREPNRSNFTDADPNGKQPTFETLNDFEAGYSFQSKYFSAGANLYLMLYKDQLILTGEINDVGSAIMVNVDDSYRAGIELTAGVKILSNLTWDVNATFSQNKIMNFTEYVDNWDTGGQEAFEHGTTDIAFSPNILANSMINYELFKNLKFGLVSQYVGRQYIDNSSNPDRVLDAYFVNNLNISYTVFTKAVKEIEFRLMVNNLFNEEYETNAWVYSYIYGGERYKMDGYFPQAGINFLAGVSLRF